VVLVYTIWQFVYIVSVFFRAPWGR